MQQVTDDANLEEDDDSGYCTVVGGSSFLGGVSKGRVQNVYACYGDSDAYR